MNEKPGHSSGGASNVPADEVPPRSNAVRKELGHWMTKIRQQHLDRRQSQSSGSDIIQRAVPDIWEEMKHLARQYDKNAVQNAYLIRFADKSSLENFLDDDLERKAGERHEVIVNADHPFTIDNNAVAGATIKYHYVYVG